MSDVTCPKCGLRIPFIPELAGREIFCLGCGSHFVIPVLSSSEDSTRLPDRPPTSQHDLDEGP